MLHIEVMTKSGPMISSTANNFSRTRYCLTFGHYLSSIYSGIRKYLLKFWYLTVVLKREYEDTQIKKLVKLSENHIARGSTGPQQSGCRFRCGVLVWVYCLTFYPSLCSWIEYQGIVICIYYRRVIHKCRSRHGRDRMVVGLTTTCAISAYHL